MRILYIERGVIGEIWALNLFSTGHPRNASDGERWKKKREERRRRS